MLALTLNAGLKGWPINARHSSSRMRVISVSSSSSFSANLIRQRETLLLSPSRFNSTTSTTSNATNNSNPPITTPTSLSTEPSESPLDTPAEALLENESPAIKTGYLYFDSTFPIKLGWWDFRQWIATKTKSEQSLLEKIKNSIPEEAIGHDFNIVDLDPRLKDGGTFVTFKYRPSFLEERDVALHKIEASIKSKIKSSYQSTNSLLSGSFLNLWGPPSVHMVRGRPFKEDMNRWPSQTLKVEFQGGNPIEDERLFELLRPYGKIRDISVGKTDAEVTFSRMRGATSARNCAHGLRLDNGPRLVLTYKSSLRSHKIWEWLTSHPRLVFPVFLFLMGTITYAVFDPIRSFFVESKLNNTFNLNDYKIYAWLKNKTVAFFIEGSGSGAKEDDWWERKEAASNIKSWLSENPSTFITISGPRGSGKHQLLSKSIDKDVKHLVIDCEAIAANSKTDAGLVNSLANETGYWPVFSWVNSISNLIDLAAVGLIGSKAGFSTPVDAQLRQVLGVTTGALHNIKQKEVDRREKEAKKKSKGKVEPGKSQQDKKASPISEKEDMEKKTLSLKESLEADLKLTEKKGERVGAAPVVVINSFHHKGVKNALLWQVLAEWAAELVTNSTAHVVFVSSNPVATQKELSRALPNVPFENVILADADSDRSRGYVAKKLHEMGRLKDGKSVGKLADAKTLKLKDQQSDPSNPSMASSAASAISGLFGKSGDTSKALMDLDDEKKILTDEEKANLPSDDDDDNVDQNAGMKLNSPEAQAQAASLLDPETAKWVDKLGGRLTDLENLIQKVSLGQSVDAAVQDIIARCTIELRKNAFGEDASDASSLPWTRSQAWNVVSTLSKDGEANYYGLLHGPIFNGDENALKSMEQAEIISVYHVNGRASKIKAGRPVFQQAIQCLVDDRVFTDTNLYLDSKTALKESEAKLRAAEEELKDVSTVGDSNLGKGNEGIRKRARYLDQKIREEQLKIEALEIHLKELKNRLEKEKEKFD